MCLWCCPLSELCGAPSPAFLVRNYQGCEFPALRCRSSCRTPRLRCASSVASMSIASKKFFLVWCPLSVSLLLAGSPTCSALLPYGDEKNFVEDDEEGEDDDEDDYDDEDDEEYIKIKNVLSLPIFSRVLLRTSSSR